MITTFKTEGIYWERQLVRTVPAAQLFCCLLAAARSLVAANSQSAAPLAACAARCAPHQLQSLVIAP